MLGTSTDVIKKFKKTCTNYNFCQWKTKQEWIWLGRAEPCHAVEKRQYWSLWKHLLLHTNSRVCLCLSGKRTAEWSGTVYICFNPGKHFFHLSKDPNNYFETLLPQSTMLSAEVSNGLKWIDEISWLLLPMPYLLRLTNMMTFTHSASWSQMDQPILTWAWRLLGLNKKKIKSVGFAYSIHAMRCDYQRWHFLTSVVMLMHMLLRLGWAQARAGNQWHFHTACDQVWF